MKLKDKLLKHITHIKKGKNDVARFVELNLKNGCFIEVWKEFCFNFYNVYFWGKDNDENKKFNSLNEALEYIYMCIYNYSYKECEHDWDEIIRCRYICKKCGESCTSNFWRK